ncbi:MAG: type II toxin-antitoxin system RelE/ParE family toxin [Actinomycetota bacterium]|nr:type II toxin-antitoxin system RelE/ParE family toxin [Actinomycetota bacterium]
MWEIVGTDEFADWYRSLDLTQCGAIDARVDMLEADGPALGRPVVDSIKGSRHHNMKELRCSKDGALRILFAFDPIRRAVLLLGGDKAEGSAWSGWYLTAIPHADDLYDSYLTELREEGLLP